MAELRVVLVCPQEDGNVGSIARAMKNFGFKELYLVNPCKLGSMARAFSSHGLDVLESAVKVETIDEALAGCDYIVGTTGKKGGQKTPMREAITPEQFAERFAASSGKTALVFGNERIGLKNSQLKLCDATIRIPSNPEYPILNLAQSVCVVLYELGKREFIKCVQAPPAKELETAKMKESIHRLTQRIYDQEHRKKRAEVTMRRILGKAFLTKAETNTVTSVCDKAMDKITKR
jgi:tRNA/rRNA methyltransferase